MQAAAGDPPQEGGGVSDVGDARAGRRSAAARAPDPGRMEGGARAALPYAGVKDSDFWKGGICRAGGGE